MSTIYDSLDKNFKTPTGPLHYGEVLTLRINLPKTLNPENVQFIIYELGNPTNLCVFPMELEDTTENSDVSCFKVEVFEIDINIYLYYFSFTSYGNRKFVKIRHDSWEAYISEQPIVQDWQLTVYSPVKVHPKMSKGIMYQIFPDRFAKSDKYSYLPQNRIVRNWGELPYYEDHTISKDFFGGNLEGIIEKLPYLKKLGVTTLYLTPIWESAENHRYATSNYEEVDPLLGNSKDLERLIEKVHSYGMIIILDVVINHTGSDSIYFNKNGNYPSLGAYQSNDSPYRDWYYFFGNDGKIYKSWWGYDTLPEVNQDSHGYIDYFFNNSHGLIPHWRSIGIDGFRLDVADELTNATLKRIYSSSITDYPSTEPFIILGEVWDNASNKWNYGYRMEYLLGSELTSVMNYPVKNALLAYVRYGGNDLAYNLKRTFLSVFVEDYPKEIVHTLMNFLSSHDTIRAITQLSGDISDTFDKHWWAEHDTLSKEQYLLGRKRLMLCFLILYLLPGIPSIFYGDEVGLAGQKDPFCRKCFPWNRIDKKLLKFMRCLAKLRNKFSEFLSIADFNICEVDQTKLIFFRYSKDKILFVFVNRSDSVISFDAKQYVKNYLFNHQLHCKDFDLISNDDQSFTFFFGKNSNLTSLDSIGAVVYCFNLN